MTGSDEDWISDALIAFLQGPEYTMPLLSFIDEKCLVFDLEEENKLEFTEIHQEYKRLVDSLLTDKLTELGTPVDKFVEAVAKSPQSAFVINSILSVDDFQTFKDIMVLRNVALTEEVLMMSTGGGGAQQQQQEGDRAEVLVDEAQLEQLQLQQAMTQSMGAGEAAAEQLEEAEFQRAIRMSLALEEARQLTNSGQAAGQLQKDVAGDDLEEASCLEQQQQQQSAPEKARPVGQSLTGGSAIAKPRAGLLQPGKPQTLREAAEAAARNQKKVLQGHSGHVGTAGSSSDARQHNMAWLADKTKQLVSERNARRQQELDSFRRAASSGTSEAPGGRPKATQNPPPDPDGNRARLREQLALEFKQRLVQEA